MSTLIVTAHPDPASLTHRVAALLGDRLGEGESTFAHLAQEEFDPRFTMNDREVYVGRGEVDTAVAAEQERLDRADHLVLVFPVFWWSMPALLKGWIDRVFIGGWAFDLGDGGRVLPQLQRLTAHLLPVSGFTEESFIRHGYEQSFRTQIEHGIVDYCGMRRGVTAFVRDSESTDEAAVRRAAEQAVAAIAEGITAPR